MIRVLLFTVADFPSTFIPLGVEITHIALNANESFIAVVYRSNDQADSLCFGYVDMKMFNEQVSNSVSIQRILINITCFFKVNHVSMY